MGVSGLTVSCFADVLDGVLEFYQALLVRGEALKVIREKRNGLAR